MLVRNHLDPKTYQVDPGGSDGYESACNTGDPGSISGSGRSPGEGNGHLAGCSPRGHKESDTTEQLTLSLLNEPIANSA